MADDWARWLGLVVRSPRLRLLRCRQTRAASVPPPVCGKPGRPGGGVGARDRGSHTVPCAIPDGSRPLRRAVQDRNQGGPAAAEGPAGVSTVAPPRALARGRRPPPLSAPVCARPAAPLNAPSMAARDAPAPPLGLQRLQASVRAQADRLEPGADDRRVPAEAPRAERDLRPTGSARTVRVGSQSEAGAHPRGLLRAVRHPLKQRPVEVVAHRNEILAPLALEIPQDPYPRLFPAGPT